MGAWASIPHLDACSAWDGKYPEPTPGKCTASAPTGNALKRTGADPAAPGTRILPDGRPIRPAGSEWTFTETTQEGGATSAIAPVPGTPYVITVDTGNDDHAVRAVDTGQIGKANPVTGFVKLSPPSYLSASIAVVPPGRVYVATGYGVAQAFSFDPATGALTRDDASSITLPPLGSGLWYAAAVAASPDGKRLLVTSVTENRALLYDIDPASATYRQELGEVDLGGHETFAAAFDPFDASGAHAYVSLWGGRAVVELDLSNPAAPKVSRTFATDKNPQGFAFLDARWMAVANDFGETISLVDRTTGAVTQVPVAFEPGLHGLDVSGLAFDAANKRLYVTLAGVDAVAAYNVDLAATPPLLTPSGRLPVSWWPSGIVAHPDGSLTVSNLRGHPIGPEAADGSGSGEMKGSVEHIPAPTAADLTAGDAAVLASVAVGGQSGYPAVQCPAGAHDFPVPATNTEGASAAIKHVFFIVRENKTFDTLLGDLPGVEGDASLTMKATTADMDKVWKNFRDLARGFTIADNFYSLAVKSTQGHHWTTYGRATDFCERTWSDDLRQVPLCGVSDVGRAEEGSLFEWLQKNNVVYDILGEVVGNPLTVPARSPIDIRYPGGPFQNITYNDLEKACYTAGRVRVACDLGSFVYMTLPNDHTVGVQAGRPTPEVMCSVNDEATGMFVDALSHSPLWASSLVVITEDDPQQGGDHVDYHRTPLVLVGPWVKRHYVSQTHVDVASLHKIFAHVFGLPYPNLIVKNAGLPLDAFTSTPDFTPYTYQPRTWPLGCPAGVTGPEARLSASWDFSKLDAQPGLGDQVRRWMRGQQLTELPPRLSAEIEARNARRAAGLPAARDDDD
jgi:DNA-binding beta-propeller fold protein YncE